MSCLSVPPQSDDDHPSSESESELLQQPAADSEGGVAVPVVVDGGVAEDSVVDTPPPPQSVTVGSRVVRDSSPSPLPPGPQGLAGVRKDLAEIKGSLKAGLSLLSRTGISKLTANFFHERIDEEEEEEGDDDDEEEEDYVPGITDEVVEFANQISARSACWTDFPLSLDADFKFSDAQREHAATIEYMVPSLRALRVSLHGFMRSEQFWMVYFILLLPRLDEYDKELLSSPQVVNTRNRLLQKLQASKNEKAETSEDASQDSSCTRDEPNSEPRSQPSNAGGVSAISTSSTSRKKKHVDEASYFSFSDLDDDDSVFSARLSTCSRSRGLRDPSPGGSSTEWVQLNRGYDSRGGSVRSRQSITREKDSDADSTASEWLKVYESD